MPELRTDPVTGHQTIIAPERLSRPNAISLQPWNYEDANSCPFCAGREMETPQALASYQLPTPQADDQQHNPEVQGWDVRAIPNKFPALTMNASTASFSSEKYDAPRSDGLFQTQSVRGIQEVIVESPIHVQSLTQLSLASTQLVIRAYRDRIASAANGGQFSAGLLFKNFGPMAGASLGHIHSQFVAFTETPKLLQQELEATAGYYRQHKNCLFCAIVTTETQLQVRCIKSNDSFLAYCPFASRLPFELCVIPRQHQNRFESLSDDVCDDLAAFLRLTLRALEKAVPHVAYNFWIRSAAFDTDSTEHYHWHIEVLPRIAAAAGFEWGSGQYTNPVPPEQAAHQLRACWDDSSPTIG